MLWIWRFKLWGGWYSGSSGRACAAGDGTTGTRSLGTWRAQDTSFSRHLHEQAEEQHHHQAEQPQVLAQTGSMPSRSKTKHTVGTKPCAKKMEQLASPNPSRRRHLSSRLQCYHKAKPARPVANTPPLRAFAR